MEIKNHNILLADDDIDDCIFFQEVLDEIPIKSKLQTFRNGVDLMSFLKKNTFSLPDILFLDLNMPMKGGVECLTEIKSDENLKQLPVIIFSTSLNMEVVNLLYNKGANHYIRKPGEFHQLKKVVHKAITFSTLKVATQPSSDNFIISP